MFGIDDAVLIGGAVKLAGGLLQDRSAERSAHINADLQREFAQQGIRWRVEDAKAAGIHPLYALGAPPMSASPVMVGGSGTGSALQDMGQDISRAQQATRTAQERDTLGMFIQAQVAAQERRDAEVRAEARADRALAMQESSHLIDNMLRLAQLRKLEQTGPPLPSGDGVSASVELPGGGAPVRLAHGSVAPSDVVKVDPAKVVSSQVGNPSTEAGSTPYFKEVRIGDMRILMPSETAAQLSQNLPGADAAALIAEAVSRGAKIVQRGTPPQALLPSGYHWRDSGDGWEAVSDDAWRSTPNWKFGVSRRGGLK